MLVQRVHTGRQAPHIRNGGMDETLTEMMVHHESDLERQSVMLQEKERMEATEAERRRREEATATVAAQMHSGLGILNPAHGTAHVPKSIAVAVESRPPNYDVGLAGGHVGVAAPPSDGLSLGSGMAISLDSAYRGSASANVGGGAFGSMDKPMSSKPSAGGMAVPVRVSVDESTPTSASAGGHGAHVRVAMDKKMRSRPSRGGHAAPATVTMSGSMSTAPSRGGCAVETATSISSKYGKRSPRLSRADADAVHRYNEADALFRPGQAFADPSFWPTEADSEPNEPFARCFSCFDPITPNVSKSYSGRAVRTRTTATATSSGDRGDLYHVECYWKKGAPHCDYCQKSLVCAEGFSGAWGSWDNRNYHAECFQRYAGPRCSVCFDVVFVNPEKGLSGRWLSVHDSKDVMHLECYEKRTGREHALAHTEDSAVSTSQGAKAVEASKGSGDLPTYLPATTVVSPLYPPEAPLPSAPPPYQ